LRVKGNIHLPSLFDVLDLIGDSSSLLFINIFVRTTLYGKILFFFLFLLSCFFQCTQLCKLICNDFNAIERVYIVFLLAIFVGDKPSKEKNSKKREERI
jgi:hypothetical protein